MYAVYIKRLIDIIISALVLLLLGWLYIILIILVKIKLGSPVFFAQERPGKNEKIFKLYKFRTMRDAYDENGEPLPDEERLTSFGKKLRSTSLDELPEFWNILKGDMSFVGPRPWLVSYLPLYTEREHCRHDVRPGLTGWAQVHGRNCASWSDRLVFDLYYVDNISFWLDIKTVILTIVPFFRREGISSETSETCEKFEGTHTEETTTV
ncbi:MAG: sugar transferase [Clostridiales bacterium]|nr:sugar transferase [Candidatus Equinaster intestinalis]